MKGYPSREEAHRLVREAELCNPGPWGDHSRVAAMCAEKIAAACGLDAEKAYVLGLLHDIGRKFGVKHLAHVYDGYQYMLSLGYPDAARICLTHSFCLPKLEVYIGNFDLAPQQQTQVQQLLEELEGAAYELESDRMLEILKELEGFQYNGKALKEAFAPVKRKVEESDCISAAELAMRIKDKVTGKEA